MHRCSQNQEEVGQGVIIHSIKIICHIISVFVVEKNTGLLSWSSYFLWILYHFFIAQGHQFCKSQRLMCFIMVCVNYRKGQQLFHFQFVFLFLLFHSPFHTLQNVILLKYKGYKVFFSLTVAYVVHNSSCWF